MFICCCGKKFVSREEYSNHLEEEKHWENDRDQMLQAFEEFMIEQIKKTEDNKCKN
jgi:hypothetical protein